MELRSLVQSLALLLIYGSSVARLESSRASASGMPLPLVSVCPDVAVIFAGQELEFNCTFTFEDEGATITWLRDDQPLTEAMTEELAMGGRLVLQNIPQLWDGAQIVCRVETGNATASASSNLTVFTPPTSLTIQEGMPFSLACEVRGQPVPTVTWSKDGMPFRPDLLDGVEMVEGGLQFGSASDDFSGEYVCTASPVGTGSLPSPPAIVKVLFAPRFGSVPQPTSAENGSMVVLSCRARGCPEPTITWTHNAVSVAEGNDRVQITPEGDLQIMNLMLSDAGMYRCMAENSQDDTTSDNAMLSVLVRPSIIVLPEPLTATVGGTAELSCFAMAIPAPTYSWTHNGSVVATDSRISISNGSLIFAPVQREDFGVYVCVVENGVGPAVMSNTAFLTVYAPPLPPETLQVLSAGSTWLQVQWGASPEANPAVLDYTLEYRLSFQETWLEGLMTDQMQANVTMLYPNATYQLRVTATSPIGVGDPSEPFPGGMTEPGVPLQGSTAESITVQSAGPNGLLIQWTVRAVVVQTSYSGATVFLGAEEAMSTTGFSLPVGGLEPATSYSIRLILEFAGGFQGSALQTNGTTDDDIPSDSPIIDGITAVTSDTLVLTWLPPTMPNGQIQSYTLYYRPLVLGGSESIAESRGAGLMTVVRNLLPFTNYSIAVSASTSAGEGPRSDVTVAMTAEGTPEVAPGNLTVFPLSSTSLRLSWQPLADEDVPGVLVNYTVRFNEKHHGGHAQNVTIEPNRTSHDLDGLRPFTVYCVRVAAVTGAGGGVFSRREEARTFSAVPEAMVEITALIPQGPTSILVQWAEPDRRLVHSDLSSVTYIIRYNMTGGDTGGERSLGPEELGAGLNYTLTVLLPATTYRVTIAVSNSNGTGPFGEPAEGTTRDGVPDAAPGGVTVQPLDATTLRVSWQPLAPEAVPGTLVSYVIVYQVAGETEAEMEEVEANRSMFDLEELVPFTDYSVMVAGATDTGTGPFSQPVNATTLPSIPDATVDVVDLVASCSVSITVSWSNPDPTLYRAPVESVTFVVIYSKVGEEEEEMKEAPLDERMVTLEDLLFNTTYDVRVAVKNEVGIAQTTGGGEQVRTGEGVPSVPRSVTVTRSTPDSLTVIWQPPTNPGGRPSYEVEYEGPGQSEKMSEMIQPGELSVVLEGLAAFTVYSIKVRAMTSCGYSSFSAAVEGRTGESPPGPPVGVAAISITGGDVVIGWAMPQLPNGDIMHYQVSCPGTDSFTVPEFHAECSGLDPETEYTITVAAVNGAGLGEVATVDVRTACNGAPPTVRAAGDGVMVMVREGQNCSVRAQYVLVLVQELELRPDGSPVPPARSLASYSLQELRGLTAEYSASRSRRQSNEGVYIAGNVTSGDLAAGFDLGDGRPYGGYINHPLGPGESYNVGLRGSDTPTFMAVEDPVSGPTVEEEDSFPLITVVASAGAAGVCLVAILATIAIIATCCCCSRSKGEVEFTIERASSFRMSRSRKSLHPVEHFRATHKTFALESHPPVPVTGFVNKLLVMRTNDNQLFLEEFGSIEMAQAFPCDAATQPANRSKNRYNNIIPYDHSRVKLNSIRGQHGSTYINGNYCAGYTKQKAYIATQGPLKDTISDFWRMVWEENSKTIVMLTNPVEKAKVKCEVYWPRDVGSSEVYGNIDVTLVRVTELADYSIRVFSIQKVGSGKESREVRQFHFTSWPDHGVPQYATAMLSMTRRVRSYNDKHKDFGPIVVHCSAGVGRSGTFIAIHSTLERLDAREELVDIYGHVSLLRSQRNYMVQTEDQYFFIHEAVAEWIVCGNTEVSLELLSDYVNDLYQIIPEDEQDTTFIELEFKRLAIDKNDPHRFASANRDANKSKNRYVNVLPYEANRVYLDYMRGVDGSDYINASHIDSYHWQKAFIATQGPLKNTVVDFWRMVWKYNSPVVVMLTKLVEKGTERSVQYWPAELLQTETYGSFSIEMTVERNSVHYTYRDLHITDPESGQKRLVRHFHFHAWPEVGVPSSTVSLIDFLREVQKLYSTLNTRAPITVHCSNGVGRSGVFIALHMLLERMQTEGLADVFQTVKNLRIQRPAMVQTLEQYQFTYDAAVDYLDATPELLPLKSRLRSQGSNASELRRSRRSRTTSPQRSESFNTKGSSRNLEMGNGSSQVYGGSEATSTFGTAQQSSPRGSLLGSQQLHSNPAGPEQTVSVRLSYPLEP